jgi:hypothetical protein
MRPDHTGDFHVARKGDHPMSETKAAGPSVVRSATAKELRSRWIALGRDGLRDTVAGTVAAVVLIANIVSFGALMFPAN